MFRYIDACVFQNKWMIYIVIISTKMIGRLTAQWSAEDEEEAARERRRRERERQLRSQAEEGSTNPSTPSETGVAVQESR